MDNVCCGQLVAELPVDASVILKWLPLGISISNDRLPSENYPVDCHVGVKGWYPSPNQPSWEPNQPCKQPEVGGLDAMVGHDHLPRSHAEHAPRAGNCSRPTRSDYYHGPHVPSGSKFRVVQESGAPQPEQVRETQPFKYPFASKAQSGRVEYATSNGYESKLKWVKMCPTPARVHQSVQELEELPSPGQAWGNWNPENKPVATRDEMDSKLIAEYVMQGGTLQSLSEKSNVPTQFVVAALESAIKSATKTAEPTTKSDPWWNGYVGRKRG